MKLKKKYSKQLQTASPNAQCKYRMYVEILNSMKADCDDLNDIDYMQLWVEQIDRGGLCHISDEALILIQEIELKCRQFLDTRTVPTDHIIARIEEVALSTEAIMQSWRKLASSHHGLETDMVDLLKAVITLWSTIRVHSFAEGWSDKFSKNFKKGTRKTLKEKNTDKDST